MKQLYLVTIILGIIINIYINCKDLKKQKNDKYVGLSIIFMISMILGSKLLDFFVNYKYYFYYNIFESIKSGYMFYGGMLLSTVTTFIYCKINEIDTRKTLETIIQNTLVLYSIWKLGCFFNGCCIGINDIPIQLIEAFISIITYALIRKNSKNKIAMTIFIFGIIRLFSIGMRKEISHSNFIINDVISLLLILTGIADFIKKRQHNQS